MDKRPIGVFDSGLGGLTFVKELRSILPNENIVFFGDTGHVPYGTKSNTAILSYADAIISFLREKNVKMIVAACGTASSVIQKSGKTPQGLYTGVVKPAVSMAQKATKSGRIGLIGTPATVKAGAYTSALGSDYEVFSLACPLFVPLVENGMFDEGNEITTLTVRKYLSYFKDKNIDTLILGCTHYPLLSSFIAREMGDDVKLIDAGASACAYVKDVLTAHDILSDKHIKDEFYVSDSVDDFIANGEKFLGGPLGGEIYKKVL